MASNEYSFRTHWRVRASPDAVYDVLEDPTALPEWWPAVYLDVTEVNGEHGDDSVYDLFTTGWLPYTLRWRAIPGDRERPRRIELARRRATTADEHARVPDPPGPTGTSTLTSAAVVVFGALLVGFVLSLVSRFRRR